MIVLFTGLPASGKTTTARNLAKVLSGDVEVIDGDALRDELGDRLGFDQKSREINCLVAGLLARQLARRGVVVLLSFVAPYKAIRAEMRDKALSDGLKFFEVYLEAPEETLMARRPEMPLVKLYEPSDRPSLALRTDQMSPDECVQAVLALVKS
jgi:adenylylsulfate kinase-like enzyme